MPAKLTLQDFVDHARAVHGYRYGYAFSVYQGNHVKLMIHCREHGFFEMTPANHKSGHGCPRCDMRLMHGDCLERMKEIPSGSVDMVLADPPYGTTACKWDTVIDLDRMWERLKRVIKPNGVIALTASQPFTSALVMSNPKMFKHDIVWFKNVPTGMAQANYAPMKYHESILVFCKNKIGTFNKQMQEREGVGKDCYRYQHYCGESNHVKMDKVKKHYDENLVNPSSIVLFNSVPNRRGKVHPTQKPVALMEYLIKTYTNEGETVLDFTMGSGTTGVACANTGRKFIGIELDTGYFEVASNRIDEALAKQD